jgi:quinol monooxygenase YgiN
MAEIVIAGEIYFDAARRAACLEAGRQFQEATRRDEPGCLAYVFAPDPVDAGTIMVYERWADAASLEAHFLHQNYFDMRGVFAAHGITGASIKKFRIDAEDTVYVDGVATASFPDERA